jgi:hypothetical protein
VIWTVFSQVRHWVVEVVVVVVVEQQEVYYKSIGVVVVVVVLLMGVTMDFQVLGFPTSCKERSSHVFVFCTLLAGCTIWRDCKTLIQQKEHKMGMMIMECYKQGTERHTLLGIDAFCVLV